MPGELTIREVAHLSGADLAAAQALIKQAHQADGTESIGEHKFLRLTGEEAGGVKAVLAFANDRLVGYANSERFPIPGGQRMAAELVVHPEHRHAGVGSRLLAEILTDAKQAGADRIDVWAHHQLPGTAELAARFDFKPIRILHEIRMLLPASLPDGPLPQSITVRAFVAERDGTAWLELNNLAFAGHPEQGNWDEADLRARLEQPWFDAQDFLLCESAGRLAGFHWMKLDEGTRTGEIYVIGVHPDFRRQHLGRALTILGLVHMHQRGMTHASAYVDAENTTALNMYLSLGFEIDHSDLCYSRSLSEAPAG